MIRAGALLCALALFLCAPPAWAGLRICNQTSYIAYAAIGIGTHGQTITQGWTRINPGDCADALPKPLTRTKYYLYARSSRAYSGEARDWGGDIQLCTKDTNFALLGSVSADCDLGDSFSEPYATIDTHAKTSWTTTLTEDNPPASLDAIRARGVQRLLTALGYKIAGPGAGKAQSAALADFRKRMKLAPGASYADLFDALETAALKVATPSGYSICNDTAGDIWAAIAIQSGLAAGTTGWWKIAPGACARALTEPLTVDRVFLHVEGHNKPALVSGPAKFCIANITFEVRGAANCAARGLTQAGFAATVTKGMSGYAAHVGNDGLVSRR